MKQFQIFFGKEMKEMARSFKWIWVPLVFLVLGIMDAIMNYYMEDILSSVGNLPEGFEITLPEFKPVDIFIAATSEFQLIGIIIVVCLAAGSISKERQNGTATLLYVRPISYASYYLSKWASYSLLMGVSIVIGYFGTLYYTNLLYGSVSFKAFLGMLATYIVWQLFAISFALTMSACFKTSIAMAISIIAFPVFLFIDSIIGTYWKISPWKLGNYGVQLIDDTIIWKDYYWTLAITLVLTVIFLSIGIIMSRKKASTTKI